MTHSLEETLVANNQEIIESVLPLEAPDSKWFLTKFSKDEIRSSLQASTLDGVFATLFSTITGGVLLSNFLIELNASPFEIGMLASIAMVANLLQPLGAYWADLTTSRRWFGLWVYGISRALWLPLAIAIIIFSWHPAHPQQMIVATLAAILVTHALGAIGSASWLSWLAALVPRRLRGRYFGFRNSVFSLTGLLALPLLGVIVSHWPGGSIQGFGIMVIVAVGAGLVSLGFQSRMTDINPQVYCAAFLRPKMIESDRADSQGGVKSSSDHSSGIAPATSSDVWCERDAEPEIHNTGYANSLGDRGNAQAAESAPSIATATLWEAAHDSILNNFNFLLFLLYFGIWAFGVNLSNPFFNLYLLDNLALDLGWVTAYNGLAAGANLLMLLIWGKLADQIGNRTILLLDGVLVAITPLFWLGTDAGQISIWLWFPLLHLLGGGTVAAVDLCINNLQLAIAPAQHHTKYFALTAAVGGVTGALGALIGGWLAQQVDTGGITGVFALSSMLRLVALLPLIWLHEPQGQALRHTLQRLVPMTSSEEV